MPRAIAEGSRASSQIEPCVWRCVSFMPPPIHPDRTGPAPTRSIETESSLVRKRHRALAPGRDREGNAIIGPSVSPGCSTRVRAQLAMRPSPAAAWTAVSLDLPSIRKRMRRTTRRTSALQAHLFCESPHLGQLSESRQRLLLELTDPLAADSAEPGADLVERVGPVRAEAEAHGEDRALALAEAEDHVGERRLDLHAVEGLEEGLRLLLAQSLLDRGRLHAADGRCARELRTEAAPEIVGRLGAVGQALDEVDLERLGAAARSKLLLEPPQLSLLVEQRARQPDVTRLEGDRPRDGLLDPPDGVGRELVAAPIVELLDGADQSAVALLDQIDEREALPAVALGASDHEPEVVRDESILALGEPREGLLRLAQRARHATDLLPTRLGALPGQRVEDREEPG